MCVHRLRRLAAACRLSTFTLCSFGWFLIAATPGIAAAEVTGTVVDATGRVLPRAYVRVLDAAGAEQNAGFSDESGRFTLTGPSPCQVEAALSGFRTATLPCAAEAMRITLALAPVQETTVVTATRTDAPASQVGASLTVYTADDLERLQEPLLADLLVAAPGAMLMRNGGPGGVTSLFVRGGESDYNKILLDGIPLNEGGGTYYLNNLTTENLERIEVVRGAYSSLFGSDAMSSVIQLFTKRPAGRDQRPQATAQFDGGTYGTTHSSASVTGSRNRLDYNAGAALFDTDNRVPNSHLKNTTLSGNLGVRLSESATLRVVGRGELETVGTPGPTAFGRPDLDAFFERHDKVGNVSVDQQLTSAIRQRASYSLAASSQQSTNLVADPAYTAMYQGRRGVFTSNDFLNDTLNALKRHHAGYQADIRLAGDARRGTHTLTLLADWDGERLTATNRRSRTETVNARDNYGFSAQQQMLWRRLFVTVGGRIEQNGSFGTAAVPRATAVFVVHQPSASLGETRVRASAGTGVKEPTMLESFSESPFFLGNPDLQAERSRSVEVGLEQRLAGDHAKLELAYFDNRFSDVISLVSNPDFTGRYQNVGVTRARGLELNGEAAPSPLLRVRFSYTLLDGKVLESSSPNDPVFGLGQGLFRRPRHSGSAGVTLAWARLSATLNGIFVGKFVDSDFGLFSPSFLESPGHQLWDARATVGLSRQLTAILTIDNLTNQDYSEPLGYQPLLRTVRAGVRVKF